MGTLPSMPGSDLIRVTSYLSAITAARISAPIDFLSSTISSLVTLVALARFSIGMSRKADSWTERSLTWISLALRRPAGSGCRRERSLVNRFNAKMYSRKTFSASATRCGSAAKSRPERLIADDRGCQ